MGISRFSFTNLVRLVTLVALTVGLAGCGGENQAGSDTALKVEWTLWDGDYTLQVALAQGYFVKYGVKVQPVYYENFSDVVPDLVAGKLDGGLLGMIDLMNATSRTEMNAVAVYDSGGTLSLATAPGILSPADLKGKRIGVGLGTSGEVIIRDVLQRAGMSIRDVTLVNVPVEKVPDALPDTIDAGVVYEPYTSQVVSKGARLLEAAQASALLPDVIVFRAEVAQRNPQQIQNFLKAWFEAVEYRKTHPEFTRNVIAAAAKVKPSEITLGDVDLYSLQDNQRLFGQLGGSEGSTVYDIGRLNQDFLVSTGSLTHLIDMKTLFNPVYLPSGSATGYLFAPVAARPLPEEGDQP